MGDIYGRVRTYNLGFAIFTFFSLMLSITWMTGTAAGIWLVTGAHLPGCRRGDAVRQLGGDPDRRLPRQPARHGARRQPGGRVQRLVHRARPRRAAGADQLAADLLGVGAHRALRHRVRLLETARGQPATAGSHRLARQHHLRDRPGAGHGGDHLRDRALRELDDGMDQPGGDRRASRRRAHPDRLLLHRDPGVRADVPVAAVQDPGLHQRCVRQLPGGPQSGRPHVHADHLAAGHLAPAARVRVRRDPACGRASRCSRSPSGCSSLARSRACCRTDSEPVPSRRAGCSAPPPASHCSRSCRSTSPTGPSASCSSSPG